MLEGGGKTAQKVQHQKICAGDNDDRLEGVMMRREIFVILLLAGLVGCRNAADKPAAPVLPESAELLYKEGRAAPSARPVLQVSGVMISDRPSAIINGNILGVGMEIDGAVVKAIANEGVTVDFQGDVFTVALNTAGKNDAVSGALPDQKKDVASRAQSQPGPAYQEKLMRAGAYVAGAQEIVRQNRVMALKDYEEVLLLYGEAATACREALEQAPVDARGPVRTLIASVDHDRRIFLAAKAELDRRIRETIDQHKLIFGMTAVDVKQSIGRPDRIQRSDDTGRRFEQWEYEERDGTIRQCLYFYNEIFVAYK